MVQNLYFSGFDDNYKFCDKAAICGLFFKRPLIRFSLPNFVSLSAKWFVSSDCLTVWMI